jgi:hypothetical protein
MLIKRFPSWNLIKKFATLDKLLTDEHILISIKVFVKLDDVGMVKLFEDFNFIFSLSDFLSVFKNVILTLASLWFHSKFNWTGFLSIYVFSKVNLCKCTSSDLSYNFVEVVNIAFIFFNENRLVEFDFWS